jgi:hypothetical protein
LNTHPTAKVWICTYALYCSYLSVASCRLNKSLGQSKGSYFLWYNPSSLSDQESFSFGEPPCSLALRPIFEMYRVRATLP